jgi:beta-lactamase regulating signal transducer with metallopeptidase domain
MSYRFDLPSVLHVFAAQSAKASMLAGLIALLCLLPRRWLSPPWRHVLWCAVFARLILPDFPIPEPQWSLNRLLPQSASAAAETRAAPWGSLPAQATTGSPEFVALAASSLTSDQLPASTEKPSRREKSTSAVSAVALAPAASFFSWSLLLGSVWLTGTLVWWMALAVSWWRFKRRVLSRLSDPGSQLQSMLATCVAETRMRSRVRLKCSDLIDSPAVCGVLRPVILIPHSLEAAFPAPELRLLILHELGHVKRRDALVQVTASVLLGLHWWNPVLWYAWRRLCHEGETATDAWVLRSTGPETAHSYGAMLLNLASRACTIGISMFAMPSLIGATAQGRRLRDRLASIVGYRPVGRLAGWGGAMALLLAAVTGFSQSSPAPKEPAPDPALAIAIGTIGGVITDEKGKPIKDAIVEVHLRQEGLDPNKVGLPRTFEKLKTVTSDVEGRWQTDGVPAGAVPDTRNAFSEKKGAYKLFITHPEFLALECSTMGPIFGADAEFRQKTARLTLRSGHVLRGMVRDEQGKGISGATVERVVTEMPMGTDPKGITGADGRYEISHARPGDFPLRVRCAGYALQQKRLVLNSNHELDIVMLPATTVSVKVRDKKGLPVANTTVAFSSFADRSSAGKAVWSEPDKEGVVKWQGAIASMSESRIWSDKTDQNGMLVWTEAPNEDLVAAVFGTDDLQSQTKKIAAHGTAEFTLAPKISAITITLRVKSTESGKPLGGCSIETGIKSRDSTSTTWMRMGALSTVSPGGAEGEYLIGSRLMSSTFFPIFRVKCADYAPAVVGPVDPAKGNAILEVALQPRQPVTITVLNAEGTPAANARVTVAWSGRPRPNPQPGTAAADVSLISVTPIGRQTEFSGTTDSQGRCTLPAAADDAGVLITNSTGCATGYFADLMKDGTMKMRAYRQGEDAMVKLLQPKTSETGLPGSLRMRLSRGDKPVLDEQALILSCAEDSDLAGTALLATVKLGVAGWSYGPGKRIAQAACRTPEGTYCFGPVKHVDLKAGDMVEVDSPLQPGIRIAGKVSDEVPRPVKDAQVMVIVNPEDNGVPSELTWSELQTLREDGTFEFRSLSPGYVTLCVLADGWTSPLSPEKAGNKNRPWSAGVITQSREDLVVPMQRTAACEVTVVDDSGSAVRGATVRISTYIAPRGLGNLSIIYSTRRAQFQTPLRTIEDAFAGNGKWSGQASQSKNLARVDTDDQGRALLEGLPALAELGNLLVIPPAVEGKPRTLQEPTALGKALQSGETMKITVRLKP